MADRGRGSWLFRFEVKTLLQASQARLEYHEERVEHWKGEYEKAVEAARAKVAEVVEYDVTGGKRAQLVINPTLETAITLASNKRSRHQEAARVFGQWVAVFESQSGENAYELTMDDALFFGVAENEAED